MKKKLTIEFIHWLYHFITEYHPVHFLIENKLNVQLLKI